MSDEQEEWLLMCENIAAVATAEQVM